MISHPEIISLVMAIIFALTSLVLLIRLRRIKTKTHNAIDGPRVPSEIKQASREMVDQVSKLRDGLHRIASSENPLEALVEAISRDGTLGRRGKGDAK